MLDKIKQKLPGEKAQYVVGTLGMGMMFEFASIILLIQAMRYWAGVFSAISIMLFMQGLAVVFLDKEDGREVVK